MKKKILSLMLAVVMMLSLGVTAGASTTVASVTKSITLTKNYTSTNGTAPSETFYLYQVDKTVSQNSVSVTVPDIPYTATTINGTIYNVIASVTLSSTTTSGDFEITLPSYSAVGVYTYKLAEVISNTAGVTYVTDDLYMVVYVTNGNTTTTQTGNSTQLEASAIRFYKGSVDTANKIDEITNSYGAGTLAVSKIVTGNTGDKTKEFTVKVTLTSSKTVNSVISYTVDGVEKTIESGWSGTKEIEITLKDGETITFINIPDGVTYTVVEDDYTTEANGEYDTPDYDFSDTYKTINTSDADTVKITNNKETTVDTGVILDSLPYILILIVVAAGAVVMITRKRRNEDL